MSDVMTSSFLGKSPIKMRGKGGGGGGGGGRLYMTVAVDLGRLPLELFSLWCYYGRCGLVPDFSITNEFDQSQPSLEASITEEIYQTYHGSYQNYGLGSFGNSLFYLQYRRDLL